MAELLCELGLPRSSDFYHRARLQVADKYVEARQVMADIFKRNYRCYGYRRMRASLTDQSVNISEKVVRRLMKQECLWSCPCIPGHGLYAMQRRLLRLSAA